MSEDRVNLDEQAKRIHTTKLQYMASIGQLPLPYGVPWGKAAATTQVTSAQTQQPQIFQRGRFNQQRQGNPDRSRTRDNGVFSLTIYNILAHNYVNDLISDIQQRCGNLEKIVISIAKQTKNFQNTELVVKVFFSRRDAAENCYSQYNGAKLDDKFLRTEKHY